MFAADDDAVTSELVQRTSEEMFLFYPLGLTYLSARNVINKKSSSKVVARRSSHVRLYGLTPDTIRLDHCRRSICSPKMYDPNRIVLRQVVVRVPATFNLYTVIMQHEETTNVEFVQNMIVRFVIAWNTMNESRRRRDEVYGCSNSSTKNTNKTTKGKTNKLLSMNGKRTTSGPSNSKRSAANDETTFTSQTTTSSSLELAMEDLTVTVGSMYELIDGLSKRLTYETGGVRDYESSTTNVVVGESAINNENQMTCNLYVWRMDDQRMFDAALKHLVSNAPFWSNVYNVPASMDDPVLRFSLDTLIEQLHRNEALKRKRVVDDAIRTVGTVDVRHSSMMDFALNRSSRSTALSSIERLFNEYQHHRRQREEEEEEETVENGRRTVTDNDATNTSSVNLHRAFAFGEWCLYRKRPQSPSLVLRIDRETFDRMCRSLPDLERVLTANPKARQALYTTPLSFLPTIVWDIETIARNPATLPRGTSSDEKLVSMALTIERSAFSSRTYNLVTVLVPATIANEERESIGRLKLLDQGVLVTDHLNVRDPIVRTYRDERAMLVDLFAILVTQLPLLHSFLDVDVAHVSDYQNVASFLVGHNVIGYDFTFLHNRFVYHGMMSMAAHLSRNVRSSVNDIVAMYTFNDAQLCVDTLLFLMSRVQSLGSFDLGSVLTAYRCDVSKGKLDARAIRFFYNALDPGRTDELVRLGYDRTERRLAYFKDYLLYNLYDCLSLASLLRKLAFDVFVDTTVKFFRQSLNVACYCGNSRLLPSLFTADMLANGREILPIRPRNVSLTSVDRYRDDLAKLFADMHRLLDRLNSQRGRRRRPRFVGSFSVHAYHGLDRPENEENANDQRHHYYEPYLTTCLPYSRQLDAAVSLVPFEVEDDERHPDRDVRDVRWLDPTRRPNFNDIKSFVGLCDSEHDLLRVGNKTYIGGMNYADPCHVKNPILMDYKSFYPSIIRHFELDMNNVSVFTVLKLLLAVGGPDRLDELFANKILRAFDYTPEESLRTYVNVEVFHDERFDDVFLPASYARREWFEGIEIDSAALLICSSKLMSRRVLVVWRKSNGSAVSRIVTQALARRAVWKQQRKTRPDDKVLESRELMEKLLANVTYGYLNFKHSVIFSRPTAAAVTLLCRNTFSRTRFIVESREALARFDGTVAERYRACVNYIDTDGCIVSLHEREPIDDQQPQFVVTGRRNQTFSLYDSADESILATLNVPRCLLPTANLETWSNDRVTVDKYLRLTCERKQRFVEIVNEMLGMKHVTLESEEENAIAASIFGRKKYTLLKLTEGTELRDCVRLKKTGFEKNAVRPLKTVYDILLYNVMRLNHLYGLNTSDRFVAKIVDHRSMLYAIFDTLYDMWKNALRAERTGEESEFRIKDFATRIPLNPRQTGGKLSRFIDSTLHDFKYDQGDRVHVIHAIPIDEESIRKRTQLYDSNRRPIIVYDSDDTQIQLLDHVQERLDDFVPDFRRYLNSHLTYMYECVEGWKTVRGEDHLFDERVAVEPIGFIDESTRRALLDRMRDKSGFVRVAQEERTTETGSNFDTTYLDNGRVCYLKSMSAIGSLFFSLWLWDRVLKQKHISCAPQAGHGHVWREMENNSRLSLLNMVGKRLLTVDTAKASTSLLRDTCSPNKLSNAKPNNEEVDAKSMRYCSPHMFLFDNLFDELWFKHREEHVTLMKNVLFDRYREISTNDRNPERRRRRKLREEQELVQFLSSGMVLYKDTVLQKTVSQ